MFGRNQGFLLSSTCDIWLRSPAVFDGLRFDLSSVRLNEVNGACAEWIKIKPNRRMPQISWPARTRSSSRFRLDIVGNSRVVIPIMSCAGTTSTPTWLLLRLSIPVKMSYGCGWPSLRSWHKPEERFHDRQKSVRLRMAQFAKLALYTIGFTGTPVAPESDWGELDSDALAGIWTKGALARVRLGALAAMLVKILPREAKKEFAAAFNVSAALDTVDDNRAKAQKEFELCEFLTHGALPFGDSYLPELLVTLNPTASRRDATQAIVEILDEFKRINGIPDQRTQEKKTGHISRRMGSP